MSIISYQDPSIVKLHKLLFEIENNHQEDPTHDDATVLDEQRGLGHCRNTMRTLGTEIWSKTTDFCLMD